MIGRCKFDSSNMTQMRDFSQRQRELFSGFSQEGNQDLEDQRQSLTEVTSQVWRRDKQENHFLAELCLQGLHMEDVTQQPKSRFCWTASAPARIGSGSTATSRDVWRISSCSSSRWTRNWSTSTKRSRTSATSTTSKWWQSEKFDTNLEPHESRTSGGQLLVREVRSEIMQLQALAVAPVSTRDSVIQDERLGMKRRDWKPKGRGWKSSKGLRTNAGPSNSWMSSTSIRFKVSMVMTVSAHRYHQQVELRNQRSVTHHKLEVTPSYPTNRAFNAASSTKIGCSSRVRWQRAIQKSSIGSTQLICSYDSAADWNYISNIQSHRGPWLWRTQKERPNTLLLANGLDPQNLEVRKYVSRAQVTHSSQYPRSSMLWIGAVEDAKSIDYLITLASMPGKPNTRLRESWFQGCKVTTIEREAPPEQRSLTGGQIAWMIHDFLNNQVAQRNHIGTPRDFANVQWKNDNVQAFDTKWDDVSSAITDRPADNKLGSLYKMQIDKSEELKYLMQIYAQETTFGIKKKRLLQIEVDGSKTARAESQGFSFQSEKWTPGQTCNWSSEERNSERKRQNKMRKTRPIEEHCVRWDYKRPMFIWRFVRIQTWTKTRKAKERDDLVHLLRQFHLTENRQVMEKVVVTQMQKDTPKLSGKSTSGKAKRLPCVNFEERKLSEGKSM